MDLTELTSYTLEDLFRGINASYNHDNAVSVSLSGDTINININVAIGGINDEISSIIDFSAQHSGTVKVSTVLPHQLPVGVTYNATISNTTNYNGMHDVTYIDDNNFYFTHPFSGTETGIFNSVDVDNTVNRNFHDTFLNTGDAIRERV